MKTIIILLLSIIQLPCIIEGWISYLLSSIMFFTAIVSLIWWPLDMLCALLWAGCEYIKQKCLSHNLKFSDALVLYTHLFPIV